MRGGVACQSGPFPAKLSFLLSTIPVQFVYKSLHVTKFTHISLDLFVNLLYYKDEKREVA